MIADCGHVSTCMEESMPHSTFRARDVAVNYKLNNFKTTNMKRIYIGILIASAAGLLTSCDDSNPWHYPDGYGGIEVMVSPDSHVTDAVPTRGQAYAPDADQFGLKITKNDGSYSKTWESVASFSTSTSFESGLYTLEAFYGTPDDEGFNKPYYRGTTAVTVRPGETTDAAVTAQLANTMVDVKYTEAFRNYFSDYSTSLHSEGYGHHEIPRDISDPLYLVPGNVAVTVSFTKPNGQSATIQPAEFAAEARHFYHLTLDVNNGQVGDAQLVIHFDDTVQTEDVEIDLSDELLNMPAPEVSAKGFDHGTALDLLENSLPPEAKFAVYAPASLTSAVMTIESDNYTAPFGREVELASAPPSVQTQLQQAGVNVLGLYKNPDKLATVDVAGLVSHLPAGTHSITLVAKDRLTRVNDPVTLVVNCHPVELDFVKGNPAVFGANTGSIVVAYNGTNPEADITVSGLDDNGIWTPCPVTGVTTPAARRAATRSDAFPAKNYNVALSIPVTSRDMQLRIYHKGKLMCTGILPRTAPEYTLTSNDFATKTVLRIGGVSGAIRELVTKDMRLYAGGSEVPAQNISRNTATGEITVIGLQPATQYHFLSTVMKGTDPEMGADLRFTTESAQQPQNGAMESWASSTIAKKGFIGAEAITVWWPNSVASNSYWASRNPQTTFIESGFAVTTYPYCFLCGTRADTGVSGNAAAISTVGWGYGTTWAGSASVVKHKTAGMLFMGDYSYDGTEHISYGREFTSRPSSLGFDYKYAPAGGESFHAYAVIEHREGNQVTELGRGELISSDAKSSFVTATVPIKYTNSTLKATHAYIVFVSSTGSSFTVSQGSINGKNAHVGSTLTVDNVKFNY